MSEQKYVKLFEEFVSGESKQINENVKRINEEGRYIKVEYERGGLKVTLQPDLDEDDLEDIQDSVKKENGNIAFYELFEDIAGNSPLRYFDMASDIGQMSEAPVIGYELELSDDGSWYPSDDSELFVYDDTRQSVTDALLEKGEVIFSGV